MLQQLSLNKEARLRYGDAQFDIIQSGDYVVCAVSGTKIPLDRLSYWSVEYQEPYKNAEIALRRWRDIQNETEV